MWQSSHDPSDSSSHASQVGFQSDMILSKNVRKYKFLLEEIVESDNITMVFVDSIPARAP